MLCFKCGRDIPDDSALCPYCGQRFTGEETNREPERKNHTRTLLLGLALAAVLALAGTIFGLLERNSRAALPSPPPETPAVTETAAVETESPEPTPGMTPAEAAKNVLFLRGMDILTGEAYTGSGFLVGDNRTLVTNYHVIYGINALNAQSADKDQQVGVSTLLAWDADIDLAILRCDAPLEITPLELADSDEAQQGDPIYAAGYPRGIANTLSDGIIGSRYIDEYGIDTIQITAPVSPGSSGGPLLNENGQVVGVMYAVRTDAQNVNFAIASNMLSELMENMGKPVKLVDYYADCFLDYEPEEDGPVESASPAATPRPGGTARPSAASTPAPTATPTPEPAPAPTPESTPEPTPELEPWEGLWRGYESVNLFYRFDLAGRQVRVYFSAGADSPAFNYPFTAATGTSIEYFNEVSKNYERFTWNGDGSITQSILPDGAVVRLTRVRP